MTVKHVSAPKTPGLQAAGASGRPGNAIPVSAILHHGSQAGPEHTSGDLTAPHALPTKPADVESPPVAPQAGAARPAGQTATVDYYAIISKTVAGLVLNNPETRGGVYERARDVVNQRLLDGDAEMPSRMVAIEQIAFDRAIQKIEAEQSKLDATRPPPPPRPRTEDLQATSSPEIAAAEKAAKETAEAGPATPQPVKPDRAPAITVARRPVAMPQVKHIHGGTLRLFAVVAVIVAGIGGYWVIKGKPSLFTIREIAQKVVSLPPAPTSQSSEADVGYLQAPANLAAGEQPAAGAAAAPNPIPDASAASPAAIQLGADEPGYVGPVQRETDLATFLSLCRTIATPLGEQRCGNLEPRPFGGPSAARRNAPEWVAMYADLADTIPAKRVLRPTFSLPTPPAQIPAQAAGEQQAVGQVPRTTSSAAQEKYDRGLVLSKTDNLDGAVASFSEAIKLDPKFADALVQRGQLMFRNGNPEGAVADFTKALDIDPRNAAAYKARGMAILYKGDNDGAIIDLTKAIQYAEIDPTSLPAIEIFYARRSRASLYDLKQLYDRELIDLNAMVDGFWKNPALAAALKAAYREQGTNTLMASVYRLRAGVHQRRRNPDSAVGDLSFAIQLDPQRALQYIIERARVQEAAGKREQAMADYQQALELSPANTDVKSALARLKGRT